MGAGAVLLQLGRSRYAVGLSWVSEVVTVPLITRVPDAAPWLCGVVNWRGRILTVLDLRPLLGCQVTPLPTSARVAVLTRGDLDVGVLAEAVPGVRYEGFSTISAAPATLTGDSARLVIGQVRDETGPVAVLDVSAIIALRDRIERIRHGG